MTFFDFLRKKIKPENNTVQENHGDSVIWDSPDAVFIGDQHISGTGMHISCKVKYSPSNRTVVCRNTSTSNASMRYETLEVPAEINTADGLIAFIVSKRPWLVNGYRLSDELRQRIDATFNGKTQQVIGISDDYLEQINRIASKCPNDKHNFVKADVYTGGTLYKCDKCGLEVHASMLSGTIFKEYFGSYIGGISHKWNSADMRVEDIVSFAVSFGDLPIVTVTYDGSVMKVKNSINGSRDGWRSFPEGYFDEKTIKLSDIDKSKLNECLLSFNFEMFTTSQDLFRNFGAPGFCISNRFLCRFSNGKGFECLSPRTNEFIKFVSAVRNIVGLKQETFCEKTPEETTTHGVIVSCCNKKIPDFFKHCPYCGESIEDKSKKCDVPYDSQATLWFCFECGSDNQFDYKFCGNCGIKRPW